MLVSVTVTYFDQQLVGVVEAGHGRGFQGGSQHHRGPAGPGDRRGTGDCAVSRD